MRNFLGLVLALWMLAANHCIFSQDKVTPKTFADAVAVVKGHFESMGKKQSGKAIIRSKEVDGTWAESVFKVERVLKGDLGGKDILKIELFLTDNQMSDPREAVHGNQTVILMLEEGSAVGVYRIGVGGEAWLEVNPFECADSKKVGEQAMCDEILHVFSKNNFNEARLNRIKKLVEAGNQEAKAIAAVQSQERLMLESALKAAAAFKLDPQILSKKLLDIQPDLTDGDLFIILRSQIEMGNFGALEIVKKFAAEGKLTEIQLMNLPSYVSKGIRRKAEDGDFDFLERQYSNVDKAARAEILRQLRNHGKTNLKLSMVALDDQDVHVRYQAIYSLSRLFKEANIQLPGVEIFESNPSSYTDKWKQWILENPRVLKQ